MHRKYVVLLGLALAVLALDQWTKYLALARLTMAFEKAPTIGARLGVMYSPPPKQGGWGHYHYRIARNVTVSEKFFRFTYAENPGAAWGLFRNVPETIRGPLFHLVSIGAVLLISYYFSKLSGGDPRERWALWGLPLVLGGALGNYADRIARGFVIDFLDFHWKGQNAWPTFNIADAAICVGVGMLVIDSFLRRPARTRVAEREALG